MAVDMSNVKQIMHNNKEVIKIEDSNGKILWENNKESTIRISIGSGQDINITQYHNYIQIPPMPQIKNFIANKIGVGKERITLTDMKIDGSTLYWNKGFSGTYQPYLSFQSGVSSSTVYFGGGSFVSNDGTHCWFLDSEVDLYDIDLKNDHPTILYGYMQDTNNGKYYKFGSGGKFCDRWGDTVPTFTIIVTYETT